MLGNFYTTYEALKYGHCTEGSSNESTNFSGKMNEMI